MTWLLVNSILCLDLLLRKCGGVLPALLPITPDLPGNHDVQLALFHTYRSNPSQYPKWHDYFRKHQPPTLVVWGKNDPIFPPAGAEPYRKDLKTVEFHLLDTGHFALEEDGDRIADLMRTFLWKHASTN